MTANVIVVLATVVLSYLCGDVIAIRRARETGRVEPKLFDYGGHRVLWSEGMDGYRRDPWYWGILIVAIAIVDGLTRTASFGVGFAAAAAFGFAAHWAYRAVRRRRSSSQP